MLSCPVSCSAKTILHVILLCILHGEKTGKMAVLCVLHCGYSYELSNQTTVSCGFGANIPYRQGKLYEKSNYEQFGWSELFTLTVSVVIIVS